MLVIYMVRERVALHKLRANNEVAGFKFATVGVLYAVLLAFAVLVVWEKRIIRGCSPLRRRLTVRGAKRMAEFCTS